MDETQTQTQTERNKAVILEILTTGFSSRDFTALDRYLHPDYVQHNAFIHIPPANAGLRGFIADRPDTTRYEPGAITAEGDLVMVHGRYSGGFDKPLLGIDIFPFEDGLVVEQWDVLQDEVAAQDTVAGNPMFTNPQAGWVDR
ncbi:nuclear transport factor 2 family protein [Streptomyces mirabilis]|uniref:nuclear transport factor 2 family protein n=1 Tax=Streptomyces mirabilis TaxID=68239 RepID=UPI0021C1991C|nr:nuclear transport factor 2 family protein [Streptomyces mirabilis]MCT9108832.1 nuclear transport factor 2 family protein [Streptomyces mirabilis]